ncbi:MAG: DUF4440 domain-containing protein [Pirellula sp.]|nr:DUF4440 domain-containing protein [Pirellula sp.]
MTSDEQAIRQLVTTWMEATKRGDTATVLSLMTDDVVFLIAGREPMFGKAAFAAALPPPAAPDVPAPQIDGESEIQEIQVHGDWAFLWSKLQVTVTPPGNAPPIVRAGHTLTIFTKQNGQWLLARDANMLTTGAKKASVEP